MRIRLGLAVLLCGCSGSSIVTSDEHEPRHEIRKIATNPAGFRTTDAIVKALNAREDFDPEVMDMAATKALLAELGIDVRKAQLSRNLKRLPARGVDGWLDVRTDDDLRSVRVRLSSTHDPTRVLMIKWKNAWGGAPGSPADRMMRKDLESAAEEIAAEIATQLNER